MKLNILLLSGLVFMYACKKKEQEELPVAIPIKIIPDSLGNNRYSLQHQDFYMEVDASKAGRIVSLTFNDQEFLISSTVNATNWGNSFWPSPQSKWNWPPPAALDVNAYDVEMMGDKLVLTSDTALPLNLKFVKAYRYDAESRALILDYTIVNTGVLSQSVAPWEITRVNPNGLTFYPTAAESPTGTLAALMKDSIDMTWFDYDPNTIPAGTPKLFANGEEGWMAHVSDSIMLVKRFENISVSDFAPNEAEIEFYANPNKTYIEIEQQGKYLSLAAGDSLQWRVKWFFTRLASGTEIVPGNQTLVNMARRMK